MELLEKIVVITLLVYAIWYTYQDGEMFVFVQRVRLPNWLAKPLRDCPICQSAWYGTAIYWIIWGNSIKEGIICAIGAVGLNAVIAGLKPKDEIDVYNHFPEVEDDYPATNN